MPKNCLSCNSNSISFLFSLGSMPPVNAFIAEGEPEQEFPLNLYFCECCNLIQLGELVPPEKLFSNYLHMSSASSGNKTHLNNVVKILDNYNLIIGSNILEIGSNDGFLLSLLKPKAASVIGVDPASNLAIEAKARNVNSFVGFFDETFALSMKSQGMKFDTIIALNVMAHTPTFISALKGIKVILNEGGTFMMENAYVVDTILQGQFDTIYHEHVFCFSLHSLLYAFNLVGFKAVDAEIIPTQGKSIRIFVKHKLDTTKPSQNIEKIIKYEKDSGFQSLNSFKRASSKILIFKNRIKNYLEKNKSKKFIGLGAPARGVVILNYCDINKNQIEFIVDDTPLKRGKLTPGSGIPVKDWSDLNKIEHTAFILLSWNYADDIIDKLKTLGLKGSILIPFPEFREIII